MSKITYTSVAALCNTLSLAGSNPSVRKIQEKLGGSFTPISEYLKQWRTEKDLAKESDVSISSELQNAILAEFTLVARKVQSSVQAQLNEQSADLQEALEEIENLGKKVHQLEHKNNELEKILDKNQLAYEKRVSADEATINYLKDEKKSLHEKLAEANKLRHESELREAIANTRAENLSGLVNKDVSKK